MQYNDTVKIQRNVNGGSNQKDIFSNFTTLKFLVSFTYCTLYSEFSVLYMALPVWNRPGFY
jgi:hypothetical protein